MAVRRSGFDKESLKDSVRFFLSLYWFITPLTDLYIVCCIVLKTLLMEFMEFQDEVSIMPWVHLDLVLVHRQKQNSLVR